MSDTELQQSDEECGSGMSRGETSPINPCDVLAKDRKDVSFVSPLHSVTKRILKWVQIPNYLITELQNLPLLSPLVFLDNTSQPAHSEVSSRRS